MSDERTIHPAGDHNAVVIDHGLTKSMNGTDQIAVKFETEFGKITAWFALTDQAAQYTAEKVRNMGFRGSSFYQLNDGECIRGNRCVITVGHEEYQGRTRAKVRFVNPEGWEGFEIKRDEQAAMSAKRFDALLHKLPVTGDDATDAGGQDDGGVPF